MTFSQLYYSTLVSQNSLFSQTKLLSSLKKNLISQNYKGRSYMSSLGERGFLFADVPPLWGSLGRVKGDLTWKPKEKMWSW